MAAAGGAAGSDGERLEQAAVKPTSTPDATQRPAVLTMSLIFFKTYPLYKLEVSGWLKIREGSPLPESPGPNHALEFPLNHTGRIDFSQDSHILVTEFGDVGVAIQPVVRHKISVMSKLLMVCMGNICRSPMAESVARKLATEAGLAQQLTFDSAGTHTHRLGERPDRRAELTLLRHGYEVGHLHSRRIVVADFQHFDMILAMDAGNLADLRRLCPPAHLAKLHLFLDFAQGLTETEVPDPYFGNAEGFERVLGLCEAGARGLITQCMIPR